MLAYGFTLHVESVINKESELAANRDAAIKADFSYQVL